MKIEHLALWVQDLEKMKNFYEKYFCARAGNLYHNTQKQFTSYFLSFSSGCRLELMHRPDIKDEIAGVHLGIIHFAIATGSKEMVDQLTEKLRNDGYAIVGEPRTTGDGYYESVILDPEGNRVEVTV